MKLNRKRWIRESDSIRGSFSIWDLVALMFLVAFLGLWFTFEHTGERGRIIRCTGNLKALGDATEVFADDHDNGFPAAVIETEKETISWDTALTPYIEPDAEAKSLYDKKEHLKKVSPFFFCPSDFHKRSYPRSYAMSGRSMDYGWPPSSDDKTGVGISWNTKTISALLDSDAAKSGLAEPESLPKIKRSVFQDPDNTLLLTELITSANTLGRAALTTINGSQAQEKPFNGDSGKFHFGKFNYLMIDGHVKFLAGARTDSRDEKSPDIWNIDPGN